MDADRAGKLRKTRDRVLDLVAGNDHQIGELIDHDHYIGKFLPGFFIVAGDIARRRLCEKPVPAFHLDHDPVQRSRCLLGLGDDRA